MIQREKAGIIPLTALLCLGAFTICVSGQQLSPFAGEYVGSSGPVQIKLHLLSGSDGSLTGTIDIPSARVVGTPISDVSANGNNLGFSIPAIRGRWTGFLSADGKTLSGMYNQGSTVPLDLQRVASGESEKVENQSPIPVARPSASPESLCPAGSMANYWDGASWKPLTIANESGKRRDLSVTRALKSPLNPMAGKSLVFVFDGAAATITLGENPRFCFPISSVNSRPEYSIGILRVNKNQRDIEKFLTDNRTGGGNPLFPADKTLGTIVKSLSDRFVEVTPKEPLKPGQYVIGTTLLFDFGVK